MQEKLSSSCFIHLRLHTEYSISDSIINIPALVEHTANQEMPALAVTDLGNLFGLIKFYSSSISNGIKPICGCDVCVVDSTGIRTQLVLLVKDRQGYLNLTRLISRAYTEKSTHSDFRIEKAWLRESATGLIALSGATCGDIGRSLLEGDGSQAADQLRDWMKIFPDSFYLELQRTGRTGEDDYIESALQLAIAEDCPVVATNDVRFLQQEDFDAHEVRVCINERRTLDDPRRSHNYSAQQYLRSAEEMRELFADIPEAIENTIQIAKRCNLELNLYEPHLPSYPVPDGSGVDQYFRALSKDGLDKRLDQIFDRSQEDFAECCAPYFERLEVELETIIEMGFPGYFLIVMEFIQWARNNDIPVGPGRGSGAGSIVAYALGITDLDPLKYDLLFERFLNPERVSMPDFDVDFCMDGRDRVIQHVAEMYGKDAVSQIITFGTMAAKAVVRDVARVQGKSYGLADKLSKLIPFEPGMTLTKALEQEPRLGEFIEGDEDAQEIMEMAFKLEGIVRNVGKHAGGVVIAPTRLVDFTPLYCDENGENLVTQFDKNDVETAGLVKFDFLGLRTLTVIDWAVKMVRESGHQASEFDIARISLEDPLVYELLKKANTTAVFQLESRGMKDLIKRLQPSCFEDIVALVALFRPGPLQSGMVDDFIDRKHGRARVDYPHPELESVLGNTYGVILYQEQVMQIAQVLASYTLGGADMLRRAMGKKKPEEMDRQRSIFVEGAVGRGVDNKLAGSIFDLMEKFAGYGFNKSHSAAYALVSYQTAWLKAHYPAYFMAAVLTADMQNTDKIVTLIDECRSMGLPLVHPDVNLGQYNFTVNDRGEIIYGLGAIKGLGQGPIGAIIEARETAGPFGSLLDFCSRIDNQSVNKRALEALIKSGALDSVVNGDDADTIRATLMTSLGETLRAAEQSSRNQAIGVQDMFGEIAPSKTPIDQVNEPNARSAIRPWSEQQRLAAERDTLGLYLSGHPVDEFIPELKQFIADRLANLKPEKEIQLVAGLVSSVRTMKSKRGDTLAFVVLDDKSGRFEASIFGQEYEQYRDILQKDLILVVECQISEDDFNGGLRGRVKTINTLQEYRQERARRLTIHLDSNSLASGFVDELATILAPYRSAVSELATQAGKSAGRGEARNDVTLTSHPSAVSGCQVAVQYHREDSEGCILLGEEWKVSVPDDLLQRLKSEFGRDQITVHY